MSFYGGIVRIPLTIFAFLLSACTDDPHPVAQKSKSDSLSWGILIPQDMSIARAGEVPWNPMTIQSGQDSILASARRGYALFMNTPEQAPSLAGNSMSCNNCHPNGGQREKALPLVGISSVFPEYNKRSGRPFALEERIIGCLLRSINATGNRNHGTITRHENDLQGASLDVKTPEVRDLASYITWISSRQKLAKDLPWRGRNTLPSSVLIPIKNLNPKLGESLYAEWCSGCHGLDGQGIMVSGRRPGPLWGPNSWNDGAGAARTYTLAGMIRQWMPYMNPGRLSDEQAQHISAYITSKPRPTFPYKSKDYVKEKIPVDAVYYSQLYARNPLMTK